MAVEITFSNRKTDEIAQNVAEYGVLMDDMKDWIHVPGLQCEPGLSMHTQAEAVSSLARKLSDGMFNVLVIGKFMSGKNTFVQALLGSAQMVASFYSSVVIQVKYGENGNEVQVFRKGSPSPQIVSLEQFTKENNLDIKEQVCIENGGNVERLSGVDYAVLERNDTLLRDGVRLIINPAFEDDRNLKGNMLRFVPQANAIIYVIKAIAFFSGQERKIIADNFFGKSLRNVFFVVERIDQIQPGQLDSSVKPAVRSFLEPVFQDQNGRFDQELYDNRVFYTNAYGALCARTNQPFYLMLGRKQIEVPIEINDTGMPEFEAALSRFLNSEERIHAAYHSALVSMANIFQNAFYKEEEVKKARSLPIALMEERIKLSMEILEGLLPRIEGMRKTIAGASDMIGRKLFTNMVDFIMTEMPKEFNAEIENEKADFGLAAVLKLAGSILKGVMPWQDKETLKHEQAEIIEPFCDKVNIFIKGKMEDWAANAPALVAADFDDLREELRNEIGLFDQNLMMAAQAFSSGSTDKYTSCRIGPLETVLSLKDLAVAPAVERVDDVKKRDEFLKNIMRHIEMGLSEIIAPCTPLVNPSLLIEIVSLGFQNYRLPKQLLGKTGTKAFEELVKSVQNIESRIIDDINRLFLEQSKILTDSALSLAEDTKRKLLAVLMHKRRMAEDAASENQRVEEVLKAMRERFNTVYNILYGYRPSMECMTGLQISAYFPGTRSEDHFSQLQAAGIGEGYYLAYRETPNGLGGYHPANIILYRENGQFVKEMTDRSGNFIHFPGVSEGEWQKGISGNFYSCARFICHVSRYMNGLACFGWMVQPDGRYYGDDDGFGMEDSEEITLYSLFDKKGEFVMPFTDKKPDGYSIYRL